MSGLFGVDRRVGRGVAAAALACLAAFGAPRAAEATTINYVFVPGTVATIDATETITGSFSYDTVTNALTDVNVILTGGSVYSGAYDYQFSQFTSQNGGSVGLSAVGNDNGNGDLLYLAFANGLGSNNLSLAGFAAYNGPNGNEFADGAITGGIVFAPAAAVREPASLAIMAGGLALLGFTRKRRA